MCDSLRISHGPEEEAATTCQDIDGFFFTPFKQPPCAGSFLLSVALLKTDSTSPAPRSFRPVHGRKLKLGRFFRNALCLVVVTPAVQSLPPLRGTHLEEFGHTPPIT